MSVCRHALLVLLSVLSAACVSIPSPDSRRQTALDLARQQGWQPVTLQGPSFPLQAFIPSPIKPASQLTVYLEGDGFAWVTPNRPSTDPTPINPLGLRLALAQPAGTAVYLARPCQYLDAAQLPCAPEYWTHARFDETVVASLDQALDQLKARFAAERLTLVGYSGGAALALLLAARRDDVPVVVSVAGNLDHRAWTELQRLQPLDRSLNPADQRARLAPIQQWHLVGENDRVVPPELAEAFVAGFIERSRIHLWRLPGFDHRCCWAEEWPRLWQRLQPLETTGKR